MQHAFDLEEIIGRKDAHFSWELDELAAFLQEWLIFSFLRTILAPSGISIQLDDLYNFGSEKNTLPSLLMMTSNT